MLVGKASITCPYEFLQHLGTTDALQTVDRMSEIDPNYGYFCILAKNFNLDFLDFKTAIGPASKKEEILRRAVALVCVLQVI